MREGVVPGAHRMLGQRTSACMGPISPRSELHGPQIFLYYKDQINRAVHACMQQSSNRSVSCILKASIQ
jgi:hypothetical protein